MVFTTDHALNPLFRQNWRALYDLLFETVSRRLQERAAEELGCELGVTAVLHTWGQQLEQHVHIHCIVTGGGLSSGSRRWVRTKAGYLVDVVKLSAVYRERLLKGIERLLGQGKSKLVEWLEAVLGKEAVDACPNCGARGSLYKRGKFERLPWWVMVLLGLVSQPTRQRVCR